MTYGSGAGRNLLRGAVRAAILRLELVYPWPLITMYMASDHIHYCMNSMYTIVKYVTDRVVD